MALNREQILEKVGAVAAQTFGYPANLVTEATTAQDVPGWDSLSHTMFIMSIEESFGIEFDMSDVFEFKTIGDLVTGIGKKMP